MATDWQDEKKQCPFYRFRTQKGKGKIGCEGFADDAGITVTFATVDARNFHELCFCDDIEHFEECPIYEMNMREREKYG